MNKEIDFQIDFILQDIIEFHRELAADGEIIVSDGIRDEGLLASAVNSPFQTFGGEELYPTIWDKAAQLAYGLAKNHGFVDGNKRTAIHAMLMLLIINNVSIEYSQEEIVSLAVDIADGKLEPSDIANWLHSRESDT